MKLFKKNTIISGTTEKNRRISTYLPIYKVVSVTQKITLKKNHEPRNQVTKSSQKTLKIYSVISLKEVTVYLYKNQS